jgi:O-antigen/teichoic acid export membrane protein
MNLVRKIAFNNAVILAERVITAAAGFFISIWLIRYLGSENFGVYSLIFAWFTFLNVFTPSTIEQVVAREAVKSPDRMRKYLGAGVAIKIALALAGWLFGVAAAYLLGYPFQKISWLAIVLVGLVGNAALVLQVPHQIELKLLKPALADGASNLIYQAGRGLLILFKAGLAPFFWIYTGFRLLQLFFFFLLGIEKKEYRPDWKFSYTEVRNIFTAGWILLINNVFVMLISRVDQLILYPLKGQRAVGLYGSCASLNDYLMMIPLAWYLTVLPLLTRYQTESKSAYDTASHYSFKYIAIAGAGLWIMLGGFSGQAVGAIFGKDYLEASGAMFWLSTAMVLIFLYLCQIHTALAQGKEKTWLWVNGAGAVSNILLNIILIPKYGISGAGFATFFAFFIQIVLTGCIPAFRQNFNAMMRAVLIPLVISAFLVFAARVYNLNMFVWLPVMWVVFLLALVAGKSLNRDDLALLKKVLKPGA